MRVALIRIWGLIREFDLTTSIEYLLELKKQAKDFEIIEYKGVGESAYYNNNTI